MFNNLALPLGLSLVGVQRIPICRFTAAQGDFFYGGLASLVEKLALPDDFVESIDAPPEIFSHHVMVSLLQQVGWGTLNPPASLNEETRVCRARCGHIDIWVVHL